METEEQVTALWHTYAHTRAPTDRQQLILHYAPLVKFTVGRLAMHYPTILDADDIHSIGTIGLIEALDRFDPDRGVKFQTYAFQRIRGKIMDALRQQNLVPRGVRRKAREIEAAMAELEHELGYSPSDHEVAARLGITLDDYYQKLAAAHVVVLSLDETESFGDDEEDIPLRERVADTQTTLQPEPELERHEMLDNLMAALAGCLEREKLILKLYYYEELTLREISHVLGVSEARVSQIHTKTLLQLRARLRGRRVQMASR